MTDQNTASSTALGKRPEDEKLPVGSTLAYGLQHAATFALLAPGQAFTTPRGDFHWYAVHQAADPCVQVWVHRCAPDARAPSMACQGD